MRRIDPAVRFWRFVVQDGDCWKWTGSLNADGYGHFKAHGQASSPVKAHRYAYELMVGPIPPGLQLDHLCRNTWCVNALEHLDPVTSAVNTRRAKAVITHCPQGHPYDTHNTYLYQGRRGCRVCIRAATARARMRSRAA